MSTTPSAEAAPRAPERASPAERAPAGGGEGVPRPRRRTPPPRRNGRPQRGERDRRGGRRAVVGWVHCPWPPAA